MTQNELAALIGVTDGAISQWEKGRSKPSAEPLLKMAEVFQCMPADLLKSTKLSADMESA